MWELVASLSKNGWQHAVREPPRRTRGRDPEPLIYSPGSDKIWFTRLRTTSISSHYLRALLLADSSGTEVQHFQSSGFYMALLDGKPYTRCRRVHLQIKHFAEDDMDAGYEKPKRQRPKKAPTSDRVFAVPVEDGPVQEDELVELSASGSYENADPYDWIESRLARGKRAMPGQIELAGRAWCVKIMLLNV